jgi:NitT/TauT family transport system substrate-binding protein
VIVVTALVIVGCSQPAPTAAPTSGSGAQSAPAATSAPAPGAKPAATGQAASQPARSLGKVTIAQPSQSLSFSPVLIADKKGYFKEAGLDVEVVNAGSGSKAAAAVIGGSAQVGASDLGDMVGAAEKGQDVKIFASLVSRPTVAIVLRKSVADRLGVTDQMPVEQRVKALKGLKMSISTPGSGTDVMLRYLLSAYGVDPERDLDILTTGSVVNSLAAYVQGAADGASLSSPSTETAVLQNDAVFLVRPSIGEVPALNDQTQTGIWASGKWLNDNPEMATGVMVAIWRAMDYMRQNSADAAEIVRQEAWKDTDPQVFDLAWRDNAPTLPETPAISTEGLKGLIAYIGVTEKRQVNITPEALASTAVFDRAKAQLGR